MPWLCASWLCDLWLCALAVCPPPLAMESHLFAVSGISNLQLDISCWRNQDDPKEGNFPKADRCSRFEERNPEIMWK